MPIPSDETQIPQIVTKTEVKTEPAPPPAPFGAVVQTVTVTQVSSPLRQFGRWGAGLISSAIKGGSHAIASGTVATSYESMKGQRPFDSLHGLMVLYGVLFVAHATVSGFWYLQSHPIPDEWDPTRPETDRRRGK